LVVVGNVLLAEKIMDRLDSVLDELRRLDGIEEMGEEVLLPIRTTVEILEGFMNRSN
jgi:hypothetical protein